MDAFVALCYQMNKKVDVHNVSTSEIHFILQNIKLESPPPSNLVSRIGTLKRDPGMFSAWSETTICITKDFFMHVYPIKNPGGETGGGKKGKKVDFDWSLPHYTINLHQLKSVEMKKEDLKLVIQQHKSNFKPTKPNKKEIK